MFGKRDIKTGETTVDDNIQKPVSPIREERVNTILKGSKVTGDISVSSDLRLTGEVVGNITSEEDSNIVIQGTCNGNIRTRGGNVSIEGELNNGDIIAGGEVKITGKFDGGSVKAKEKIYINGEFKGKLESAEIELGPNAKGEGEILYQESISISKGADIEGHIKRVREEFSASKKSPDMKVINMELPLKESGEAK
jgi:cytoskeletal protein CcmA (bactofilin family)